MKSSRLVTTLVGLGTLALLFATPNVAGIFLATEPTISGDATAAGFAGQIELLTFNWGGTNAGCTGTPGAPDLAEATFTKPVDSATVDLIQALRDRTLLNANFSVTASFSTGAKAFQIYAFSEAVLTSFGKSDDGGGVVPSLEVWTLSFSRATITYNEYDQNGILLSTEFVDITPGQCVGN